MEWGVPQICETVGTLSRDLAEAAAEIGFASLPEDRRAPHYLALRKKDGIPAGLPEFLARHKVFVSVRGSSVRVTPHVYNSKEDADRLISCLSQIVRS